MLSDDNVKGLLHRGRAVVLHVGAKYSLTNTKLREIASQVNRIVKEDSSSGLQAALQAAHGRLCSNSSLLQLKSLRKDRMVFVNEV